MQSKIYNKAMKLTAATVLSSALVCSCASTRTNKQEDKDSKPKQDSVDVFVPTHPPVVVPHSWREEMDRK